MNVKIKMKMVIIMLMVLLLKHMLVLLYGKIKIIFVKNVHFVRDILIIQFNLFLLNVIGVLIIIIDVIYLK